jgi:hypothetical protein
MTTTFAIDRRSPHSDYAPPISDYKNVLVLAANTAQAFTVPAGKFKVYLTASVSGVALYVKKNATATIPSSNVTDGSGPMLNPGGRQVSPGDTISCICADACVVVAEFYA